MSSRVVRERLPGQLLSPSSPRLQRLGRDIDPTPRLFGLHLVSIRVIEDVGFPTL